MFLLTNISEAASSYDVWNGGTNAVLGTVTNWSLGFFPRAGDVVTFNNAGNGNTTIQIDGDLSTKQSVGSFFFDNTGGLLVAYTIGSGVSGNVLSLIANGNATVNSNVNTAQRFSCNLNLNGNYTFTNNATSTSGVLNITGNFVTDVSSGTVTLSGTNTGNNTISGTLNSKVTGLSKTGAGTWILSGNNANIGTTTVSAGVLNIRDANALGAIGVGNGTSVTSGATLQIQGGITTAAEALTLNGSGVSTNGALRNISGDNNYAGLITLGSATRINSDSDTLTLSNVGTITGIFGLTVGGTGNTIINSIIGIGTGTLTKDGNGTLTLSGANTYTGGTTISAGTLQINNTNAFGAGAVTNSATLDIGANTVNVTGIYTQDDHSKLKVTVDSPSSSGKISSNANAVVSAASNVDVAITGNVYIPQNATFTIIDGLGGSGVDVPGTITSSSSRVEFLGSRLNGDLILTVNRTTSGFAPLATNSDTQVVGAVLDNIINPSTDMTTVLNTLEGLSDAQISSALNTMVPTVDAGVRNNSTAALNNFVGASLDRAQSVLILAADGNSTDTGISSGDESKLNGIWAKEYGSYLDQGTRKGISGYKAWNTGTAIGVDRLFSDVFTFGVSGGYAYGKVNSDTNDAKTNINSAQGIIYAGYQDANFPYFINTAWSFAWDWYKGKRDISVGAIERTADADYEGQQYGVYLGGGYKFNLGKNLELTPLVSIQWNHLCLAGYTETDAGSMNLSVNRQSYNILQSGLGARVASQVKYKWGNFTPELHVKWLYDFIGDAMAVTSTYTGGGGSFTSNGAQPAKSSINLGGKLSFDLKNDISLIVECDTEAKDEFFDVSGSATLRYKF